MSKLLVNDENVKASKSSFAIYDNEKVKFEGKDISHALFSYRLQSGYFQAADIEIINAVYLLKYATSRQITVFLNNVRNINIDQSLVSKRLTKLNNSSVVGRYSFISDERESETSSKCYVLRERGKRLLMQRDYPCNWSVLSSVIILENIKNYLARNQYILKLIENKIIAFNHIKLNNDDAVVNCSYTIKEYKHLVLTLRKSDSNIIFKKFILDTYEKYKNLENFRLIIIGEDVMHLFEHVYKELILLIQAKAISIKFLDSTIFTQDLRIIERNINSCFIIYKIVDNKVTLEDICLNEFNIVEK